MHVCACACVNDRVLNHWSEDICPGHYFKNLQKQTGKHIHYVLLDYFNSVNIHSFFYIGQCIFPFLYPKCKLALMLFRALVAETSVNPVNAAVISGNGSVSKPFCLCIFLMNGSGDSI